MDYQAIYDRIIDRARTRQLSKGTYIERHHVWACCLGGPKDGERVRLTGKEHLLVHLILARLCPDNLGAVYAAFRMAHPESRERLCGESRLGMYERLRQSMIVLLALSRKGVELSSETRERLSKSHLGQVAWNAGLTYSDERKKAMSEQRIQWYIDHPEAREAVSLKSSNPSEKTRNKISEGLKAYNASLTLEQKEALKKPATSSQLEGLKRGPRARWDKHKAA